MSFTNNMKYSFFMPGGDRAVLLIHGITGTPSEMNYLGRNLHKAGYSVLCNSLPKHCGSLGELKRVTWQEIAQACVDDFKKLRQHYSTVFVGGLSMGALMSIYITNKYPQEVKGIAALAPTLFYDGWALNKGKVLLDILWKIPLLRNNINIREDYPYGLKDAQLREHIHRFYKDASASRFNKKALLFGSPFFPLSNLYQHHLFVNSIKDEFPNIKAPILIMHAREDDMTSLRNSQIVYDNIGSQDKQLIVLEDSYHMITIDNEKDKVAQALINFFNRLS